VTSTTVPYSQLLLCGTSARTLPLPNHPRPPIIMMVDALLSSAKSNGGTANRSQMDVSAHNYEEGKSSDQGPVRSNAYRAAQPHNNDFLNERTNERKRREKSSQQDKNLFKNRNKNPSLKMNHARYRRWISHTVDAPPPVKPPQANANALKVSSSATETSPKRCSSPNASVSTTLTHTHPFPSPPLISSVPENHVTECLCAHARPWRPLTKTRTRAKDLSR